MSEVLKPLIGVAAVRPLTRAEAVAAFSALFDGAATPAQMGGFLMALRTRGETVEEYAAAASVMRQWFDCGAPQVIKVSAPCASASATKNSSFLVLLPPG